MMGHGCDTAVRRGLRLPLGLAAALGLGLLVLFGGGAARASEGGCGSAGLNAANHRHISAATVRTIDCYLQAAWGAIKNDDDQIAQGVTDCNQQQASPNPYWTPVEQTGANLLDAVHVNIVGQKSLVVLLSSYLSEFERNYNPLGQARLDLRNAQHGLDPFFLGALQEAENEATLAGNELKLHLCTAAARHRLTDNLAHILQQWDRVKRDLESALSAH